MKYAIIVSLLALSIATFAQDTEGGVQFIQDDYKAALAQARQGNKLIFWDAYTTWCGPCKMMTKNTFPDARVSSYFNKNFINLKMDMEKGEGPALTRQYGIQAYPTLLFIASDGKVVHRALGYHDVEQFLELGKTVLEGNNSLAAWAARYEKGERSPSFLKEYALKLLEVMEPSRYAVADAYLATQPDSTSAENLEFILRFVDNADSKYFPFVIKNKSKYENADEINAMIGEAVTNKLFDEKNPPSVSQADSLIRLAYPDMAERLSLKYRMEHGYLTKNPALFLKGAKNYFKKHKDIPAEMGDAALRLMDLTDKKNYLKKGVRLAKMALKAEKNYSNQLLIAQLYDKMGKGSKASAAAQAAITIAKIGNEPFAEAEAIIEKYKKGK